MAEPPHPPQPRHGGIVDDDAGLLGNHHRNYPTSHQPGPLEIDVQHGVPRFFGELVSQTVGTNAGVVEENVDLSELSHHPADRGGHSRIVAHVTLKGEALGTYPAALLCQGDQIVAVAHLIARIAQRTSDVESANPGALSSQSQCSCSSLAMCCAGDEGNLPGELSHHLCCPTPAALSRTPLR